MIIIEMTINDLSVNKNPYLTLYKQRQNPSNLIFGFPAQKDVILPPLKGFGFIAAIFQINIQIKYTKFTFVFHIYFFINLEMTFLCYPFLKGHILHIYWGWGCHSAYCKYLCLLKGAKVNSFPVYKFPVCIIHRNFWVFISKILLHVATTFKHECSRDFFLRVSWFLVALG